MDSVVSKIIGQLLEDEGQQVKFVVQQSYQDGPWQGYGLSSSAYDDPDYAVKVYQDALQFNRYPDMKFRIIKRVVTTVETDVTPR